MVIPRELMVGVNQYWLYRIPPFLIFPVKLKYPETHLKMG